MAAADNKNVPKNAKKSAKRSHGKRKHASYPRNATTKLEKGRNSEDDQDQAHQHPLIVPMSNGHRGKQLISRSTIEGDVTQEQQQQQEQQEAEEQQPKTLALGSATSNPCVSFDEDHEPGLFHLGNENKKMKTMIFNADTETPPPLEIPTPSETPHDTSMIKPPVPPLLDIEPKILLHSQQLPQQSLSNFSRAHSLLSSEMNGLNESFHGDEHFVNPFLNESAVLENFYKEQEYNMYVNDWKPTTPAFQCNETSEDAKDSGSNW